MLVKSQENEQTELPVAAAVSSAHVGVPPGEIVIGVLQGINEKGQPLVLLTPTKETQNTKVAMSTLAITQQQVGRQVALLFLNADVSKPVIIGFIHSPLHALLESYETAEARPASDTGGNNNLAVNELDENESRIDEIQEENLLHNNLKNITVDGDTLQIEGKEKIVLKCGDSSITLTKAGKIMIRGKYILNRSSGVNRIQGGSVQVN